LHFKLRIVILCILSSFCSLGFAQTIKTENLYVRNFTIQQGLPSNNTIFTFQDKLGYIWISTFNGLAKYDGYRFQNIMPNSNKKDYFYVGQFSAALPISDYLYYLTSAHDGLFQLNVVTNEITKIKGSPNLLTSILRDADGTYWLGTRSSGLVHFIPSTGKFIVHSLIQAKTQDRNYNWIHNTVNSVLQDKENKDILWLGARTGLYRMQKKTGTMSAFTQKSNISAMQEFGLNEIRQIVYGPDGNIWVARLFGGLGKFKIATEQWNNYFYDIKSSTQKIANNNIVNSVKFSNDSIALLGTCAGAFYFNIKTNQFTQYMLTLHDAEYNAGVEDIFTDKSGNKWFTHLSQQGISMASAALNSIQKIEFPKQNFQPDNYRGVCFDFIYSKIHNHYFIATASHDGFLEYNTDYKLVCQKTLPGIFKESEPAATSVAEDDEGNIWLTSISNQLIRYEPTSQKINFFYTADFKLCFNIYHKGNQSIFHTDNGLFTINKGLWSKLADLTPTGIVAIGNNYSIYTIEGIKLFQLEGLIPTKKEIFQLPKYAYENGNSIKSIFADSRNRIWMPLEQGGVYCLQNGKLRIFNSFDGIVSNATREIREDLRGNIILLCNGGIYYFNELQQKFVDLDNLASGKTNDWYEQFLAFNQNGEIVLSKDNALYIMNQKNLIQTHINPTFITEISGHNYIFPAPSENIVIPNFTKDVNIYFSTFDFNNATELIFEYTLGNTDANWNVLDKGINTVHFSNLKDGKYLFKVRVLGAKSYASCAFVVRIIWYQSKWFYLITAIILLAIILYFLKYFIQTKNNKLRLQKRIAELRLKGLQSQLNPHFLFNCLTAISGLVKTAEYTKAENTLQNFAKLMRKILMYSDQELISLADELELTELYLTIEKLRKDDNFSFKITNEIDTSVKLKVPPMLLQPFLENSVKHGFKKINGNLKGEIVIHCYVQELIAYISIKDNGCGMEQAHSILTTSKGLAIQKERFEQYHKLNECKIYYELKSTLGEGTEVVISINCEGK